MKKIIVKKESYYDSVFLMLASKEVKKLPDVDEAVAAMGTETNVELLRDIGFESDELREAGPIDFIIAVEAEDEESIENAIEALDEFLSRRSSGTGQEVYRPVNQDSAFKIMPQSNLAVISVPGEYATREARLALNKGLHVMIFSDNIPIEDEIELKKIAVDRGLLMMGPDCGTAIINGKPLCFANSVKQGSIGLVAASGSGLQEVTCCIDKMGAGITQAIGTGGRDLKDPRVGGLMMKMGIEALSEDDATKVIVVISKPPAPELVEEVIAKLKETGKPSVICFLGQRKREQQDNLWFAESLEETARLAVECNGAQPETSELQVIATEEIERIAAGEIERMSPDQKYLRGLYAGGTLADEAMYTFEWQNFEIFSNIQQNKDLLLQDPLKSQAHTIVDLGDDVFTAGRPHPMIEPSIRTERLEAEITDPQVAVLLMDVVLGYGSHEDPVGQMTDVLSKTRELDQQMGRHTSIVASITGTDQDFQNIEEQKKMLQSHNCIVMPSNYQASLLAASIIKGIS